MKRKLSGLAPIFRPRKAVQVSNREEIKVTPHDTVVAVYYDLETTGFKPDEDHITQIGACCTIPGQETRTFDTYVITDREIPEKVTQLTGITSELLLEQGQPLETALDQFFPLSTPVDRKRSLALRPWSPTTDNGLTTSSYVLPANTAARLLRCEPVGQAC